MLNPSIVYKIDYNIEKINEIFRHIEIGLKATERGVKRRFVKNGPLLPI